MVGTTRTVFRIVLPAVLLLLGANCAAESYNSARAVDTINAYEAFLREYPHGELADQARDRLRRLVEERDWIAASESDTLESYAQFLQKHPQGRLTDQASNRLSRLIEKRDWDAASASDTTPSYQEFLRRHPSGEHSGLAEDKACARIVTTLARDRLLFLEWRSGEWHDPTMKPLFLGSLRKAGFQVDWHEPEDGTPRRPAEFSISALDVVDSGDERRYNSILCDAPGCTTFGCDDQVTARVEIELEVTHHHAIPFASGSATGKRNLPYSFREDSALQAACHSIPAGVIQSAVDQLVGSLVSVIDSSPDQIREVCAHPQSKRK